MLNKMKEMRKNKKGFTLVELIVVLVILAILAALLVPALTKYIEKAKNKQIIAETRQIVMAAQTLIDEASATKDVADITIGSSTTDDVQFKDIQELSEITLGSNLEFSADDVNDNGKIDTLKWTKDGFTCTYDADGDPMYDVQSAD